MASQGVAWKKPLPDDFNTPEAVAAYDRIIGYMRSRYIETPHIVSIETLAKCDAKCNFCPYVDIERIGVKMSDELIAKIVSDVGDLDQSIPLLITIARINEPFLDTRIFDITRAFHAAAPQAGFIFFSNGSPLTARTLDRLEALPNVSQLSLSLNDHRPAEYEAIMQIPYARAIERFDAVHERKAAGRMPFLTRITRVATNTPDDAAFIAFCRDRWPLFDVAVYRRATWNGAVDTVASDVPDVGCGQWFSIGFYADGTDPFCVMDSDGRFQHGDIRKQHLLEIYNHPYRLKLRRDVLSRKTVDYCRACPLMS